MKSKSIQIFLVIAISLSILVSSIYSQYYTLASADFLSSDLNFETFDQEILLAASQGELKSFGSSGLSNGFLLTAHLLGQSFLFSPLVLPLDQKALILRC